MKKIESTKFGSIEVEGKKYKHDIIVTVKGEIKKRKKGLSRKYFGTSHKVSKDEAEYIYEPAADKIVIGNGQYGRLSLSPEAEEFFNNKNIQVIKNKTPKAIEVFNSQKGKKIGVFHVTC
ncbi:MAG: Mth938-like domain-containing protein [Elusimicrobiota bacterium]